MSLAQLAAPLSSPACCALLQTRYFKDKGYSVNVPESVDVFPTQKQKVIDEAIELSWAAVPDMALAHKFHGAMAADVHKLCQQQLLVDHPLPEEAGAQAQEAEPEEEEEEEGEKAYAISAWMQKASVAC